DDYYEDVRIDMIGVRPIGSDPIDPDDPDPDHDDGLLVPEPATYAYALMGLASLAGLKRRIKK
ncbi:MAG: PEP-CTERM sorting domain-containing protein, partial [Abditibacteriota bacterium]|nr:PEP-CTERM sorting domain-containing protein [Abditibacteriota bacterium]